VTAGGGASTWANIVAGALSRGNGT
jgi:hypothetical protein